MKGHKKITNYIEQIDSLVEIKATSSSPAFARWKFNVERLLANEYGKSSYEFQKFAEISFGLNSYFFLQEQPKSFIDFSAKIDRQLVEDCKAGLIEAKKLLKALQADYYPTPIIGEKMMQFDVFISHANTDKSTYVNDLKTSIDRLGVKVFYDKDTLEWGDNWKQKLMEGIKSAEFAIVVISENFFGREWTEKELNEFLNRQNAIGQKIILPILHNITYKELQERYPHIADIQAIESSKYTCDQIALLFAKQLIKRIQASAITMDTVGQPTNNQAKLAEYYEELLTLQREHERSEIMELEQNNGKISERLYSEYDKDLYALFCKAMPLFDKEYRESLKEKHDKVTEKYKSYLESVLANSIDAQSYGVDYIMLVMDFDNTLTDAFQTQLIQ